MRTAIAFMIFTIIGCGKHQPAPVKAPSLPVAEIIFTSPVANGVYNSADSIPVIAKAFSTETIHGALVEIRRLNDTTIYSEQVHDHSDTIRINRKWKSNFADPTDLELSITLTLDHHGSLLKRKVQFRSH